MVPHQTKDILSNAVRVDHGKSMAKEGAIRSMRPRITPGETSVPKPRPAFLRSRVATTLPLALGLAFLSGTSSLVACMPVPPLFYATSGASLVAGESDLGWIIGVMVAASIKSLAFSRLETRLPHKTAFAYMVIANVISTIPGWFIALSGALSPIAGGVTSLLLGWITIRRSIRLSKHTWSACLAGVFCVAGLLALFSLAHHYFLVARRMEIQSHPDPALYWSQRWISLSALALAGITISTLLEEASIAWLAAKKFGTTSFFPAVARANYITLAILLLVSAWHVLPQRFKDPQFLTAKKTSLPPPAVAGLTARP